MRMKAVLAEPLLHFLAIGAALFLWFQWSGGGSGSTSNRIVVTAAQVNYLGVGFSKTWQRPPSDSEMKALVDEWVREEIAVREAVAAGLDRDDTVIRRRLRQKLESVIEGVAAEVPPTERELRTWLDEHANAFRSEPQVAFRQVYVNPDRHGAWAEADALEILVRLGAAGPNARIAELSDPTLLPQEFALAPRGDVAREFGEAFAERIETIAPGTWTGPVASAHGLHLVLVRERVAGSIAEFAAIRPAVEREVLADRRKRQLAAMYERLLEKYTVVIEGPDGGDVERGS